MIQLKKLIGKLRKCYILVIHLNNNTEDVTIHNSISKAIKYLKKFNQFQIKTYTLNW